MYLHKYFLIHYENNHSKKYVIIKVFSIFEEELPNFNKIQFTVTQRTELIIP